MSCTILTCIVLVAPLKIDPESSCSGTNHIQGRIVLCFEGNISGAVRVCDPGAISQLFYQTK